MQKIALLSIVVVIVNLILSTDCLTCVDENGHNVDWFITYKLPRIKSSKTPHYEAGVGYVYLVPGLTRWAASENSINDSKSAVGLTISSLYEKDNSDMAFVAYNDQPPGQPFTDINGHTKGILMTTKDGGIWLQHSVPHFPMPGKSYQYPETGTSNGQTFLCLTLNITQVDGIGEILEYTKPKVFNYSIPNSLSSLLPTLEKVVKRGKFRRSPPWFKVFTLSTKSLNFKIFAKGPKYHREIYADWIAPQFQTTLNVQSWLNGANPLPSNCTPPVYRTYNVLMKGLDGEIFSTHNDHSKWAVAYNSTEALTCIADLNRMEHQLQRGGAALCTLDLNIWNSFSGSVANTQPCPRKMIL